MSLLFHIKKRPAIRECDDLDREDSRPGKAERDGERTL
jgi:hypothetical protein